MSFIKKIFSSKEAIKEPEVLLEEESPLCPIKAIVEQDDRVAYFYLWGADETSFGVKSCWIRNLTHAPDEPETKLINKGIPPMLPKQYCKFPDGQEKLKASDLSLVWLEEGDAAALFLKKEILAIIPSWSGLEGFTGYARDCKGNGYLAWEITKANELPERVEQAISCWFSWSSELNPFRLEQPRILEVYEELLGKNDKYYAIDGNQWPPKGLYLRNGASKTVFATVGLSLIPMPSVEIYVDDRLEYNRIELGIILDSQLQEDDLQSIAEWISGQSSLPWDNITFLGEGHTINFQPLNSKKFNSVLLTNKLGALPKIELGQYRNSRVNFLWMVPISHMERKEVIDKGSDSLIAKLNKVGSAIYSLDRSEVV
ncbi:suppressor of fused domain protein [Fulvivirga sp. 29W222]|uniref:Suppressor of fused domain protein n=1 Tax=Fulvivirga marina TaxID=2494733 RepID=A0A937G343_9BACT|nr:suppressor of fused domain protein [Fulvivirga marina]MBL6449376.1 suppressor of fused domain protein [Fulvivirga marina]